MTGAVAGAGPAVAINNSRLRDVYVNIEQTFVSVRPVDASRARSDASRIISFATSRRVLFAALDHELWNHVFKSLHNLRSELHGVIPRLMISEPAVSAIAQNMVKAIAEYLATYEADYMRFMEAPSSLPPAHRERNWPRLLVSAHDLLGLRALLNSAIAKLEDFVGLPAENRWKPPSTHMNEYLERMGTTQDLCSICGANTLFKKRKYCMTCTGLNVEFKITEYGAKSVFVAGSFNGWDPSQIALEQAFGYGKWFRLVGLPPGRYLYKFIVDGEWKLDRFNHEVESAGGIDNHVLIVN